MYVGPPKLELEWEGVELSSTQRCRPSRTTCPSVNSGPLFSGSSSHSFWTMYTSVTQPSLGMPHFTAVAYVDDQLLACYDSITRKMLPQTPWMKKAAEEDPRYIDRYTQILQHDEENFRGDLVMLRKRYNQSEGFHTVQMMIECKVRPDGRKGGRWQYGYDGRDFISFDMEHLVWTAADPQAQVIMRTWETETGLVLRLKSYLEEICTEWFQKDSAYREEGLRKEAPVVKVMKKGDYDGMEMLVCQAYGFYPRDIDAVWTKDGEVWVQDTFHRTVAPNSDGTYHAWLSIRIDPKDSDRYRCHIDHNGLQEPLDLAWEKPASLTWPIILGTTGAVFAAVVVVGATVQIKKWRDGYRAASGQ
uniref:Class I histocompatibility antigen, F10 alpha chain-like isoform X2 n=1 Tax=Pogona vitticeps TaxID=103695 RepID=A0ABM5FF02_9SAUR